MLTTRSTTDKVREFHELFEHPVRRIIDVETLENRQLRVKLLFEELHELAVAGDVRETFTDLCQNVVSHQFADNGEGPKDGDNVDRVEELDALCDLQYVLDGKKLTSGLHEAFEDAFALVHRNNMDKAHATPDEAQKTVDAYNASAAVANKTPIPLDIVPRKGKFLTVRRDGKLIKPYNHQKVSLAYLIPKNK